jgi:hypothetical protein
MSRAALCAAVLFGLLVGCALLAEAAQQDKNKGGLDPRGRPEGFKEGDTARYAVWHDEHGWHLRTTTAKKKHHFTGKIEVEGGVLEHVHSFDLEKEGKLADHWKVSAKKHEVRFDFATDRGLDGINFHTSKDAKRLIFTLHIDGKEETGRVYVGRRGQHPQTIPFTLPAHPGK